jgi:hypothetical protein
MRRAKRFAYHNKPVVLAREAQPSEINHQLVETTWADVAFVYHTAPELLERSWKESLKVIASLQSSLESGPEGRTPVRGVRRLGLRS